MKVPRGFTCAAYVPDAVYVFGGAMEADPKIGFIPPIASVEKFDFTTQRWTDVTGMPTPTLASRCVSLDNKIYVLGGRVPIDSNTSVNSNVVQVFDSTRHSWSAAPRMNRRRAWFGAAVLNRRIYAIGGVGQRTEDSKNGYLDSAEVYDPEQAVWTLLPHKLAIGRYMLGATAQSGGLYVVGGSTFLDPDDHRSGKGIDLIEELEEKRGSFRIRGHLPQEIREMEVFPMDSESLLLTCKSHVFRLSLHDGSLAETADAPPHVASHDTAIVLTPHGLFLVGGGGWGNNTAAAFLYIIPPKEEFKRIFKRDFL